MDIPFDTDSDADPGTGPGTGPGTDPDAGSAGGAARTGDPVRAVLTVRPLVDRAGLRMAGEVGLRTLPVWRSALARLAADRDDVCHLELSEVTFVDVAGVSALAATAQRLDRGRRIVVERPPASLRRVLELFWPGLSAIEVMS